MTKRFALLLLLAAFSALWFAPSPAAEPAPEGIEFFEKKVRPLLAAHCHSCHSTDKKQKANLFLDSKAGLLKGGDSGPPVVPGSPEKSLLVKAVGYADELKMPPKGKLSAEQVADLTAWVKMGAPWPETATKGPATGKEVFDIAARKKQHWCWQPVKDQPLPEVKQKDWPTSPIDRFILAGLEAKGLKPAPPADPRTWIRRVTFDLTGLPPTPAEIDDFLRDWDSGRSRSRFAMEIVVDRLLASPHYGERWGRHWLDLVRFAETQGHEFDFEIPEAYQYRDYVIRAFNGDVPYDQLVREHVAGDLLARPRRHPAEKFNESILGTGFWFLGEAKHSPVDIRGDEADRIDNQIDVFSKTFLGLTVSCARCHDHKFDAISTADFYALYGYLSSSRFQRAFIDDPERSGPSIKQIQDVQAKARALAVPPAAEALRDRAKKLPDQPDPKKAPPLFQPWLALARETEAFPARRQELLERLQSQVQKSAEAEGRGVTFEGFKQPGFGDWFVTGDAFGAGPRGTELFPRGDAAAPVRGLSGPGQAHSGLISPQLRGVLRSPSFVLGKKKVLYRIAGHGAQVNLVVDNLQLIRDPIYGGLTFKVDGKDRPEWRAMDVSMWQGHKAYIEIIDDGPGWAALDRVLLSDDGPPPAAPNGLLVRLLQDPEIKTGPALARKLQDLLLEVVDQWHTGKLPAADLALRVEILNGLLGSDPPNNTSSGKANEELAALLGKLKEAEAALPPPRRGPAMADGNGTDERVFIRGNHKNLGPAVPRRFLEALVAERGAPSAGSGRLELAGKVVDPANPLTARVLVNRLWKHHFGEGLVRSVDNFGVLGEPPSHPELLDYLASEFIKGEPEALAPGGHAWSIKKMHRLMVLSSTYQMASLPDSKAREVDPQNRLLHSMPVRRLEAEAIRDALLAISGRLDRTMHGPSVAPHLTPFMAGRGRPGSSGPLDGAGRRSIYLNVRRNFLNPMFLAFDYPIPFTTIGKRSISNVPAQALTMLNNPFVIQQAELWAKKALAEPGNAEERVTRMYVAAYARPPSDGELADALEFLEGRTEDAKAWGELAHVLVNVKEFIFVK